MAESKKSFIAYSSWNEMIKHLPDEIAGKLFKHIFAYVNDENPVSEDWQINALFGQIKAQLKEDLKKWENQREQRSEAGKKSAENRATKSNDCSNSFNEKERNPTVNVNDNVIVNANVTANVNENENREQDAYDFLIQNCSIQLEQIWMKNSDKLSVKEKIIDYFNNAVILDSIEFDQKKLLARLRQLLLNWKSDIPITPTRKPIEQLTDNEILSMSYHEMMEYGDEGRIQIEKIKNKIYAAL